MEDDFESVMKVTILPTITILSYNRYNITTLYSKFQPNQTQSRQTTQTKVVVVGDGGVGKSSMIQRFCKGNFTDSYKKTIGVDFLERHLR